jgi:hypothetical protein
MRGNALVAALVIVIVVTGLTGAYLAQVLSRSSEQSDLARQEGALRTIEAAVGTKIVQLTKSNADITPIYGVTSAGTVTSGGAVGKGFRYAVSVAPLLSDPNLYCVAAAAGDGRLLKRAVAIVKKPVLAVNGGQPAALMAYGGTLGLSNNISISGLDHDANGNVVGGTGNVYSISVAGGGVQTSRNTELSGSVDGTTTTTGLASTKQNASTAGYPTDPDQVLRLPRGALKAAARASGTYFSTEAAFTAYASTHSIPGGVVIYLDFNMSDGSNALNWNSGFNDPPSIFVNHYENVAPTTAPTGVSDLGNAHMSFRGLMIFDNAKHFNAQSEIIGGMVSLANGAQTGNVFANGGFSLEYSSSVLAGLPSIAVDGTPPELKSWTEQGPTLGVSIMQRCLDYVNGVTQSVAPYSGAGITLPQ